MNGSTFPDVDGSHNNALADFINGPYKAEVIHRRGPWRSFEAVEYATLEWVDQFNNHRLFGPIGYITPPRPKPITMQPSRTSVRLHDSNETAPDIPGRFNAQRRPCVRVSMKPAGVPQGEKQACLRVSARTPLPAPCLRGQRATLKFPLICLRSRSSPNLAKTSGLVRASG